MFYILDHCFCQELAVAMAPRGTLHPPFPLIAATEQSKLIAGKYCSNDHFVGCLHDLENIMVTDIKKSFKPLHYLIRVVVISEAFAMMHVH